jgi:hypothetical protein
VFDDHWCASALSLEEIGRQLQFSLSGFLRQSPVPAGLDETMSLAANNIAGRDPPL